MLRFDPSTAAWRADPYAQYRELRSQDPVHWSDAIQHWVLTRYDDVVAALKDSRLSAADRSPQRRWNRPTMMVTADLPDHTRLRKPVNHRFAAATLEELRPRVQRLVDELLDAGEREGAIDVVRDFARPVPRTIISEMMGLPAKAVEIGSRVVVSPIAAMGPGPDAPPAESVAEPFFEDALARHREVPADDLLGDLVAAEERGDMDADEVLDSAIILFMAGMETTVRTIADGVYHLLSHPDQLEKLRRDPSLIASATEELLRFGSPVQSISRKALEDIELGGRTIARGQKVLCVTASANRDPEVFDDPEKLDIERTENNHVAFGTGIHACIGSHLGRLEIQTAIGTIVRRFPDLGLASDEAEWEGGFVLRGLRRLPVTLR